MDTPTFKGINGHSAQLNIKRVETDYIERGRNQLSMLKCYKKRIKPLLKVSSCLIITSRIRIGLVSASGFKVRISIG